MPRKVDARTNTRLESLVWKQGVPIKTAAERVGVSSAYAYTYLRAQKADKRRREQEKKEAGLLGPIPYDSLKPEARRAWDDFEYFRRRYFGHLSLPWHIEAAQTIVTALANPHKSFIVMNVPPGTGKTTLAHDIGCWVTVRNRGIRALMGSATQSKAEKMLGRIRRSLERTSPAQAEEDMVRLGLACDAEATLAGDFGVFRPNQAGDPWRSDGLLVVQPDFGTTSEKEHTWSAYGLDTDYLGDRLNFILWDDASIPRDLTTEEKIEKQRRNFDTVAESRLEPGGVLMLIGQRIGALDLYRHALDKVQLPDSDEELDRLSEMSDSERAEAYEGLPRKYAHIVYKAHYDELCKGVHGSEAKPYPEGCLLDPVRLPWRDCRTTMYADPATWETWYQQGDAAAADTLVKKVWVQGGTDPDTGTAHFGCWDATRGIAQIPAGLRGPLFSLASIDPSPEKYWAIQWWLYAPNADHQMFLLDLHKAKMRANEVLDWEANEGRFVGLMEQWQARSQRLGHPISHWVVERNGAQRFLLQYDHVRRWLSRWQTNIVPHDTTGYNKSDPEYGVYVLREWWRAGRVRLPGLPGEGRLAALKLVDEVQRYPHSWTTDQVMAMWFLILHLPHLSVQPNTEPLRRPQVAVDMPDYRRLVAVS